ncbi:MAG: hypothetical protein JWP20_2341 [Roseomonas sp.]|nr:hypothetical protein [Roseomonas sp.]
MSLIEYQGDTAIIYMAGEELEMTKSFWTSLPAYQAPCEFR